MTSKQVKVACLACRAHKTRCDGQNPCESCRHNQRQCFYRPSRRGGARRGANYARLKEQQQEQRPSDGRLLGLSPRALLGSDGTTDPLSDGIVGLVSPSSHPGAWERLHTASADNSFAEAATYTVPSDTRQNDANGSYETPIPIRIYETEKDFAVEHKLNAYYIFVHPYLPLLPPPPFPQSEDRPLEIFPQTGRPDPSTLPYRDRSPFASALSAILVLVPTAWDLNPLSEAATLLRETYSHLYVQAAEERLQYHFRPPESNLASLFSHTDTSPSPWNSIHPGVSSELDCILAMLMLAVYEYCQMGNRKQMRSRVCQALTAAMDLSLHRHSTEDTGFSDAHKRTWWMTMFLITQSSIFNHSDPIILKDDPRITIHYPEFRGCREPWPLLMEAQDILSRAGSLSRDMVRIKAKATNKPIGNSDEIRRLDSDIVSLGSRLDKSKCITNQVGAEAFAARNLWLLAIQLVHTSRIKLHRYIAFADKPLFLDKHCDLATVSLEDLTAIPSTPLQDWPLNTESSVFPFTAQESAKICLKSAFVICRILRNRPRPNPSFSEVSPTIRSSQDPDSHRTTTLRCSYPRSLPYLACCSMQSCYVLLMLVRLVRSCLCLGDLSKCEFLFDSPDPDSEVHDAERLVEEMRNGVASVRTSLTADGVFAGVARMAREVEATYNAYFQNCLAV